MNYCTAGEVRSSLDISTPTYDTVILRYIEAAQNFVDSYCNVPPDGFAVSEDTTRVFDSTVYDGIVLKVDAPLLSITEIRNGYNALVTLGNVRRFPLNSERTWSLKLLTGDWAFSENALVTITGKWGYSLVPPSAVKEATIMYAAWTFKRYQASLQDSTAAPELGSLIYSQAIPKQVQGMLAPFRLGMRIL